MLNNNIINYGYDLENYHLSNFNSMCSVLIVSRQKIPTFSNKNIPNFYIK